MEQTFIRTIEELQQTVKVNSSLDISILEPYLNDAFDVHILPFLGESFANQLASDSASADIVLIRTMVMRALGPLALSMASPELGVLIGDSGHTVARNDKYTVANDEKILRSDNSMQERGWKAIDRLLQYLTENKSKYPLWKESFYYQTTLNSMFFKTARAFQELGEVSINNSSMTFYSLIPLIKSMQHKLFQMVGPKVYKRMLVEMLEPTDTYMFDIVAKVQIWIANRVAELCTSQTTRQQRAASGTMEFGPYIYPFYRDLEERGNYYADVASNAENELKTLINDNAEALGVEKTEYVEWNDTDKHLFSTI